ncbi:MAG: potassium channel family protein [Sphingomonadales bacterium]|nr:potassium channel family protein [Sphingomonadales bacterium]
MSASVEGGAGRTDHALERLIFFSDAVFAIAITLLVLELRVPHLPKGSPDRAYLAELAQLIPSFAGYIISFAVIGVFWMGHHRAFTLAGRYSNRILGWNMALLGVIAFMPFSTAFFAQNLNQHVPSIFYCATMLAAGLFNLAVVRVATGPDMVDEQADPAMVRYARGRSLAVVIGAFTALLLAFFIPAYAQIGLASISLWRRLLVKRPAQSPLA